VGTTPLIDGSAVGTTPLIDGSAVGTTPLIDGRAGTTPLIIGGTDLRRTAMVCAAETSPAEEHVEFEDLDSTIDLPLAIVRGQSMLPGSDSWCQHHITPSMELFDDGQLYEGEEFNVRAYGGKVTTYRHHGYNQYFGKMIYVPDATRTLLCYGDMAKTFHVTWNREGTSCLYTHRRDNRLRMMFTLQNKVLTYRPGPRALGMLTKPDVACGSADVSTWTPAEYRLVSASGALSCALSHATGRHGGNGSSRECAGDPILIGGCRPRLCPDQPMRVVRSRIRPS
jgi:hypothetical protein